MGVSYERGTPVMKISLCCISIRDERLSLLRFSIGSEDGGVSRVLGPMLQRVHRLRVQQAGLNPKPDARRPKTENQT